MARQRMIKPEFFLHDELAELSPLHRLLFIGLWTLADREGRLEDRPKRIKVEVLPWDDVDVEEALADLDAGGFIHRYETEGRRYICLPSFLRHQRPHPKEAPSTIPSPPSREEAMPSRERVRASREEGEPSREKVRPDVTPRNIKGREKVLPSREKDMASQSESESGSSGSSESGSSESGGAGGPAPSSAPADLGELAKAWNEITSPPLPRVEQMPPDRKRRAKAALQRRPMAEWRAVFAAVEASSFCRGSDGGWRASFDWAIRPGGVKPEPAVGLLEGVYARVGPAQTRDVTRGAVRAEDMAQVHRELPVGIVEDW